MKRSTPITLRSKEPHTEWIETPTKRTWRKLWRKQAPTYEALHMLTLRYTVRCEHNQEAACLIPVSVHAWEEWGHQDDVLFTHAKDVFDRLPCNHPLDCPTCQGTGTYAEQHDYAVEMLACQDCRGTGTVCGECLDGEYLLSGESCGTCGLEMT